MADQVLRRETAEFVLGNRERYDWAIFRRQTGIREFLEEWNVSVAVERADHRGFTAGCEFLNRGNDRLVIRVTKRRVDLFDIRIRNALRLQILLQNFVRRPRINV